MIRIELEGARLDGGQAPLGRRLAGDLTRWRWVGCALTQRACAGGTGKTAIFAELGAEVDGWMLGRIVSSYEAGWLAGWGDYLDLADGYEGPTACSWFCTAIITVPAV
jgi:hypothetical protein